MIEIKEFIKRGWRSIEASVLGVSELSAGIGTDEVEALENLRKNLISYIKVHQQALDEVENHLKGRVRRTIK